MKAPQLCSKCQSPLLPGASTTLCPICLSSSKTITASSSDAETLSTVVGVAPTTEGSGHKSSNAETGLREGTRFGSYQILNHLGQGGMGSVYEAEHLENGRRVALKVLNHSLNNPDARKRFLREGRLAASVTHPNLVYIFGTEEIGDNLVISMELVGAGSLKERVQREGPLPVTTAVDIALQIISGLEVAAAAGVLHRDIKPSNCFVDLDGTIKVGDFGLSISTLARQETQLTLVGSFMGTPAFASPEQLRGDALDVRSDIYSVGVTLYFLLTGQTPFAGDNFVKVLATVLEKAPDSPAKLRREIPRKLAAVVLRCLAKKPAQRFKDYADLGTALRAFASTSCAPAPLAVRGGAGSIDVLMLGAAYLGVANLIEPLKSLVTKPELGSPISIIADLSSHAFFILYYSICEGLWGRGLGKGATRLRLVGEGGGSPGIRRALIRSAVFILLPALPGYLAHGLMAFNIGQSHLKEMLSAVTLTAPIMLIVLFSTARRRNGFAGLHDLISRTRVVRLSPPQTARIVVPQSPEPLPEITSNETLGPYQLLAVLDRRADSELLLAYDSQLLRKIWIRRLPAGLPNVPPQRQNLGRPARLRWLTGRRSQTENWDAYEALPGRALTDFPGRPAGWAEVRHWLRDLSEEIHDAIRDQSLPEVLDLSRVWILPDGRAKLLDFPAPVPDQHSSTPERGRRPMPAISSPQLLLKEVARAGLENRLPEPDEITRPAVAVPLPMHAQRFLEELPRFATMELLLSELRQLIHLPASVTQKLRRQIILICGFPFFVMAVIALGVVLADFFRSLGLEAQSGVKNFPSVHPGPLAATLIVQFIFVIVPSLICALLFRGGYVLHRCGVTFVTADGAPASRFRIFWRGLITWSLLFAGGVLLALRHPVAHAFIPLLLIVHLGLGTAYFFSAKRGLADRLAGTWMVPT